MKYFFIVFAFVALMYSCREKDGQVSADETVVTGTLASFPSQEIFITEDDPYDLNFDFKVIATTKVDSNGKFSVSFPVKEPKIVQLRLGNQLLLNTLYVYPGDELKLKIKNFSSDDFTVEFKGKSAKANEFNNNIAEFFPKYKDIEEQLYNPDLKSFLEWNNKRRQDMLNYYKDYFIVDTVPNIVNVHEISDINYQWAYMQNEWALRNYYYFQDAWNKEVIPANYWDFLKNLNFNEPFLHNFIERYLESLVWQWHINQVKEGKIPTTPDMEFMRYEFAKNKFKGQTRDIAMAVCINGLLAYQFDERAVELVTTLMDKFKSEVSDKNYIKPLAEKFAKRVSLLKGKPAPDFSLPNIFKAPIALSDFKGKVVYLYFWSTINPASKDIVPFMNNLQMQFANNDKIVFLSLGLENNAWERWKSFLDSNQVLGPQLYVEGDFSSKVSKDFMVNSLPVFAIIDKKGLIYSMSAPSPADKKLPDLLKSLF